MIRRLLRASCAVAIASASIVLPTDAPAARAKGGDEPIVQLSAVSGSADTTTYVDQQGLETWGVYGGHDLDQYLFRSGSPINFAIDLDRDFGPVDEDGRPIPTNDLYGTIAKLTLRVFDIDEDYPGTDFQPERDTVWVNGIELTGYLSGANDQWSIVSFDVPDFLLRLPTAANPSGTNQLEVRVDTANSGGDVWATEVDWAELRTGFPAEQGTAFVHGILGEQLPDGSNSISPAETYFLAEHPALDDRTVNPTFSDDATIQERAEALFPDVQDLALSIGAPRVNVVAHSLGGLVARQLAWDHPHLVDDIMMMSAPNGGIPWATFGCALVNSAHGQGGGFVLPQFGSCGGADAAGQMTIEYVTGTFNEVVRDRLSTTYVALASNEDDIVPADRAEYLSQDDPDHPGLHETRARYQIEHGDLVRANSAAFPDILCEASMYPDADVCEAESSSFASLAEDSGSSPVLVGAETVTIPSGGTSEVVLGFSGAPTAAIQIVAETVDGLSAEFPGVTFAQGSFLAFLPSLSTTVQNPQDGTLTLTNSAGSPLHVDVLTLADSPRRLTVEASPAPPSSVEIRATLSAADSGDSVSARLIDASGQTVREVNLTAQGSGVFSGTVAAPPPGMYSIAAEAPGTELRLAHGMLYMPVGGSSFGGGFAEATSGRGDGLIDELILSPTLTVSQAGTYAVSADLRTPGGVLVATSGTVAALNAGANAVDLSFDGASIWDSGLGGPFVLSNVVAAVHDTLGIEARAASLGNTGPYSVYEFRHFPVEFDLNTFSDEAVDVDGDGSFDELRVDGSIRVDTAATYAVNARLLAQDGTELAQFQTSVAMNSGQNIVSLTFDGDLIGSQGKDGPYRVADLSIYPTTNDDAVGFLVTAHQTAAYSAAEFVDPAPDALFLHNNPTPPDDGTDAQADLPLTSAEPTATALTNYAVNLDGNTGVTGRFIDKTSYGIDELDLQKFQSWLTSPVESDVALSGDAQLQVWAKMKSPGKNIQLEGFLSECAGELCTHFATGVMVPVVGASAEHFQELTVSFPGLDATIDEGNQLMLRVVVLNIPDADQAYLAYDTLSYPARLIFGD